MLLFEPSPAVNGRIRAMLPGMPAHQKPIWWSVLQGCTHATVIQGDGAFRIPDRRPAVVVLGDDLNESKGPGAFDRRSLRRYLSRCSLVSIVATEPVLAAYAALAEEAVYRRRDVAVIETQPGHEPAWTALVRQAAPLARVVLCLPYPNGELH